MKKDLAPKGLGRKQPTTSRSEMLSAMANETKNRLKPGRTKGKNR
jgi:hypothetical protein